jgi:hypothetical protein
MAERYTQVAVCCEDIQQRCFVYRLLTLKHVDPRRIRFPPKRSGDAKQFVRNQHVVEVMALRAKPHLAKGVMSMLDADDSTVEERKAELDKALEAAAQPKRSPDEAIAVLIPRRNIETWVHALQGEKVDEHTRYPRFRGQERECASAAQEFARRCPGDMRQEDLPSLQDACEELRAFLNKAGR